MFFTWGGFHSVNLSGVFEKVILVDVGSMYPTQMVNNQLTPVTEDARVFASILEDRLYRKEHKLDLVDALKLILNKTFGAMGLEYGKMENQSFLTSICIYGQLMLGDLALRLHHEAKVELVQLNTDGVAYVDGGQDKTLVQGILDKWCEDFSFTLDAEHYDKLAQFNVNNYVGVEPGGYVKSKGNVSKHNPLNHMVNMGQFASNTMTIKDKCYYELLVNDQSFKDTISKAVEDKDYILFQIQSKSSRKSPYLFVNMERIHNKQVRSFKTINGEKEVTVIKQLYLREMILKHMYIDFKIHNQAFKEKIEEYVEIKHEGNPYALKSKWFSNFRKYWVDERGKSKESINKCFSEIVPEDMDSNEMYNLFLNTEEDHKTDKSTVAGVHIYNDTVGELEVYLDENGKKIINYNYSSDFLDIIEEQQIDKEWYEAEITKSFKKSWKTEWIKLLEDEDGEDE